MSEHTTTKDEALRVAREAQAAFEHDAWTRYPDLRLLRKDDGYVNPVWDGDWRLWLRSWNAALRTIALAVEAPSIDGDEAWVRRLRKTADHLRDNSLSLAKYPGMAGEARARELAALYIREIADLHEAELGVRAALAPAVQSVALGEPKDLAADEETVRAAIYAAQLTPNRDMDAYEALARLVTRASASGAVGETAPSAREQSLAMMIRILCSRRADGSFTINDSKRQRAIELLERMGLQGSPLRARLPGTSNDQQEKQG